MRQTLLFCLLLMLTSNAASLKGQSLERWVLASGGDFLTSPTLSLSFSIGELAISPLMKDDFLLTTGFQQAEVTMSTRIFEPSTLQFSLFPNPTRSTTRIYLAEQLKNLLKISILQSDGKLVQQQSFSGFNTFLDVNLEDLPAGTYYLLIENARGRGSALIVKQ